jgi:undecaprenyl diphosphate synthase
MNSKSLNHLAIIMDGNGRWARNKNQPRVFGHKEGAQTAKKIINDCVKKNLPFLTLYTFSNENWLRPKEEVDSLMALLSFMLNKEIDNMVRNNIRFNVVGRQEDMPKKTRDFIDFTIDKTKNNSGLFLTLALSYGGRQEIVDAMNSILETNIEIIDEDIIKNHLYCPELPDADLIIRTGGENRLSNFLLWQSAYAEIFFEKKLWPDFNENDYDKIIKKYKFIKRNFGNI